MRKFNEVYEFLYKNYNDEMNQMRKKRNRNIVIAIVISILLYFVLFNDSSISVSLSYGILYAIIVITIIIIFSKNGNYTKNFKFKIISELVREFDSNLKFFNAGSVDEREFLNAEFENHYSYIRTQDVISGKITEDIDMKLSDIEVVEKHESGEDTTYTTIFKGLFGELKLNTNRYMPRIIIRKNRKRIANKYLEKIELESANFENVYDFYTENPIEALKIFSVDVIEKIVEFQEKYKILFEMSFKGDKLYLLIHHKNAFETKVGKNTLDYNLLYEYYTLIELAGKLGIYLKKLLNEK